MYTDFYGLREKPFDLTPSTRFLYLGEVHKEALALLTYGVLERKGFVLLTGEVGTGKTTIIHALLSNLGPRLEHIHLANPLITPQEFIEYLSLRVLNRRIRFCSKAEFLIHFEGFLKDCLRRGKCFVLVVDEAHRLSFDLLEEIRLLSNMETEEEKLINIFLVGQPELNERLKDPRCRALFQRIGIQYHIRPLDWGATREYVRTRLEIAGAQDPGRIFPDDVIKALYRFAKGYPRAINTLSDNVLLLGYARGTKRIAPAMVEECGRDMNLQVPEREPEIPEQKPEHGRKELGLREEGPRAGPPAGASRGYQGRKRLPLALAVLLAVVIVGLVRTEVHERISSNRPSPPRPELFPGPNSIPPMPEGEDREMDPIQGPKREQGTKGQREPEGPHPPRAKEDRRPSGADPDAPEEMIQVNKMGGSLGSPRPAEPSKKRTQLATSSQDEDAPPITITVEKGDTLRELAMQVYGRVDGRILEKVKETNPEIQDINLILVGQRIVFPSLLPEPKDEPLAPPSPSSREGEAALNPNEGGLFCRMDCFFVNSALSPWALSDSSLEDAELALEDTHQRLGRYPTRPALSHDPIWAHVHPGDDHRAVHRVLLQATRIALTTPFTQVGLAAVNPKRTENDKGTAQWTRVHLDRSAISQSAIVPEWLSAT